MLKCRFSLKEAVSHIMKVKSRSNLKEVVSYQEKSQPKGGCREAQAGTQSKEDYFPSRKVNLKEVVSMLKRRFSLKEAVSHIRKVKSRSNLKEVVSRQEKSQPKRGCLEALTGIQSKGD